MKKLNLRMKNKKKKSEKNQRKLSKNDIIKKSNKFIILFSNRVTIHHMAPLDSFLFRFRL